MSVQRIVEDSPQIDLQAEAQHTSSEVETPVSLYTSSNLYNIFFVLFILNSILGVKILYGQKFPAES